MQKFINYGYVIRFLKVLIPKKENFLLYKINLLSCIRLSNYLLYNDTASKV